MVFICPTLWYKLVTRQNLIYMLIQYHDNQHKYMKHEWYVTLLENSSVIHIIWRRIKKIIGTKIMHPIKKKRIKIDERWAERFYDEIVVGFSVSTKGIFIVVHWWYSHTHKTIYTQTQNTCSYATPYATCIFAFVHKHAPTNSWWIKQHEFVCWELKLVSRVSFSEEINNLSISGNIR